MAEDNTKDNEQQQNGEELNNQDKEKQSQSSQEG